GGTRVEMPQKGAAMTPRKRAGDLDAECLVWPLSRATSKSAPDLRMRSNLLATRRFAPLFWCQFFSAFNDNFLKQALVFLIMYKWAGPNSVLIPFATTILIFPFFIL